MVRRWHNLGGSLDGWCRSLGGNPDSRRCSGRCGLCCRLYGRCYCIHCLLLVFYYKVWDVCEMALSRNLVCFAGVIAGFKRVSFCVFVTPFVSTSQSDRRGPRRHLLLFINRKIYQYSATAHPQKVTRWRFWHEHSKQTTLPVQFLTILLPERGDNERFYKLHFHL
jgi:hypothetical protein